MFAEEAAIVKSLILNIFPDSIILIHTFNVNVYDITIDEVVAFEIFEK